MSDGYHFKSTLFEIEPGEDEEINPGRFGRQAAAWLKQKLEQKGYRIEDIINEDWGRCLMCQRTPFSLWVGVGNIDSESSESGKIVWHCFVVAELAFFKRMFGKAAEVEAARGKLDATLRAILESEPAIELVSE
jgi:hypothetical protein